MRKRVVVLRKFFQVIFQTPRRLQRKKWMTSWWRHQKQKDTNGSRRKEGRFLLLLFIIHTVWRHRESSYSLHTLEYCLLAYRISPNHLFITGNSFSTPCHLEQSGWGRVDEHEWMTGGWQEWMEKGCGWVKMIKWTRVMRKGCRRGSDGWLKVDDYGWLTMHPRSRWAHLRVVSDDTNKQPNTNKRLRKEISSKIPKGFSLLLMTSYFLMRK